MKKKEEMTKKMRNRNSSKKRKFSFNAVDATIILILIAILASIIYFFALGKDFSDKNDDTSSNIISDESANQDVDAEPSEACYKIDGEKSYISF